MKSGFCATILKEENGLVLVNHQHQPLNPIFTQKSFAKKKDTELIGILNKMNVSIFKYKHICVYTE